MKKGKILLSGLLSLTAFSVFTSVNAESYVVDSAPDTFTTRDAGRVNNDATGAFVVDENKDAVLSNQTIATLNGASGNNVIDYHTTTGLKPFCIDRTIAYAPSKTYKKDSEIKDAGIKYIIESADEYYTTLDEPTATANATVEVVKKMELSWMTQIALWQYLDTSGTFVLPTAGIAANIHDGTAITGSDFYYYSTRPDKLWVRASELATAAKSIDSIDDDAELKFYFVDNANSYELNKDSKLVRTGKMYTLYTGITLDLSKAPDGTKVYDENGNAIDTSKPLTVSTFYLEFPIENVDNYSFDFDISASYDQAGAYKAYKYVTTEGNYQPLVLVEKTKKTIRGALNFKGSHIDDTASIISRSIYFVGFLILIAGVGMIYINVKPKKEQEI